MVRILGLILGVPALSILSSRSGPLRSGAVTGPAGPAPYGKAPTLAEALADLERTMVRDAAVPGRRVRQVPQTAGPPAPWFQGLLSVRLVWSTTVRWSEGPDDECII